MSGEEPTISKSARKRANQKARAAEEAAAPAAPEPAPAPAPKGKAKAEPAPAAKAKAKAEPAPAAPAAKPKAKAKEQPAPAAAEPKAKAKAKAKEAPPPEPAAAPKPEAKAKAKKDAASKPAAKPKAQPKEEKPEVKEDPWIEYDDGKSGGWEEATGLSKKQAKQKEKREQKEEAERQMKVAGVSSGKSGGGAAQHVPGMPTQQAVAKKAETEAKGKAVPQAAALLAAANASISAASAAAKEKEPVKETVVDNSVSAAVKIPDNKIGWVIGPKGATIAMIKEKTGVKTIDTSGGVATIVGDKDPVAMAEAAIHELIQKGFTSLAFDNFQEAGVQVSPVHFPNIIGERGVVINAIKKEAKCEVSIPEVPKNSPPSKKFKITLSGGADSVKLGTEIINDIVKFGHHEVTHPGFVHQEVEVEDWKYKYLIGTKGSEMRHIQNSFHVKVNIPRETSEIQNVVVVGEKQDVERAVKHIEKILLNADQPKGRGSAETAIDPWGQEEEMESWMSPYIYKRK